MATPLTTSGSVAEAFSTWTQAWNDKNVNGYLDAYWNSEKTRYVSGDTVVRGKTQIANRIHDNGIQGKLSTHDMEINYIGSEDAVVFARFLLVLVDSGEQQHTRGVFTVHVRRFAGNWKIVSDHSSATSDSEQSVE
jgi:ketosteroid isomerase-like protein